LVQWLRKKGHEQAAEQVERRRLSASYAKWATNYKPTVATELAETDAVRSLRRWAGKHRTDMYEALQRVFPELVTLPEHAVQAESKDNPTREAS